MNQSHDPEMNVMNLLVAQALNVPLYLMVFHAPGTLTLL